MLFSVLLLYALYMLYIRVYLLRLYSTERIYFVGCVNFSLFPFSFIMLMLATLNGTLLAVGFYLLFFSSSLSAFNFLFWAVFGFSAARNYFEPK